MRGEKRAGGGKGKRGHCGWRGRGEPTAVGVGGSLPNDRR